MIVRQATTTDIPGILNIFDSLQVSRDSDAKWGFVEHPRTEEELRLLLNPYCLVAETDAGIIGCNIGYDLKLFHKFFRKIYILEAHYISALWGKSSCEKYIK